MTRSFLRLLFGLAFLLPAVTCFAAPTVSIATIPEEVRSDYFVVTINGRETPVVHAASSYYLLNFDLEGPATVSVRAPDPHYWDHGVEVQPMRYGIRPRRNGATITFRIPGPVKLSISRPGDHFSDSQMLFLLGSPPDSSHVTSGTPGVRYYGPGVHREDIEAQSGDRIYLAPGAVIFGSLTFWQVHDVRVWGRGMVIYDGPQEYSTDTGWQQLRAWHCITMDEAQNIAIEGITCVVRSRTWQIQMKDSRQIGYYNVNVIGGHPRDANQDGMDWLGSGDTTVRNCFFRASDDVFAIQGNWDGYTEEEMRLPGKDVTNITIEDSVVSTSISNTVRVGWPKKTFRSAHVVMHNLDVIHTGYGGCVVPFAFMELWADPEGAGEHTDYRISEIRLEDHYSLLRIQQPNPGVHDWTFSNITAMDGPPMAPSLLSGDVHGLHLEGVRTLGKVAASDADIPLQVRGGAAEPAYASAAADADFDYDAGLIQPGHAVHLRVIRPSEGWQYEWLFGDGTTARGTVVRHVFPDTQGTLLDGSGRFRVLLRASKTGQDEVWASRSVVVARTLAPASTPPDQTSPGLHSTPLRNGQGTAWDGWLRVPADGGYTITLVSSLSGKLQIDDAPAAASPEPRMQVCGFFGDAVQPTQLTAALQAGLHRIHIEIGTGIENSTAGADGQPVLYWDGPATPLELIPADALVNVPGATTP
ncbi:MAG TPA: hypothetical protein VJS11_12185 [Acidobacteriaceae bacterium]|nr:hypothetical protein [Acidobacteriaceae bacterium]